MPAGASTTPTPAGRLHSRTWARSLTATYSNNAFGDVCKITYSDGTPGATNSFDRLGRLTGVQDGAGTRLLAYDLAGRLLAETNTAGLLTNLAIANAYDSLGRRMSLSLNAQPSAVNSSYGCDLASRLSGVTNGNVNAAYSYLANSPLVEQIISRQNGTTRMTTTKSYHYLNRLTPISSAPSASSVVSFDYAYNNANQRTNLSLTDGTNTFTAVAKDSAGRTDTNTVKPYLPTSVTFAYDGNGNLTTNGTRFFEYDDENQLVRVTEPNTWKSEFAYDGEMWRRARTEYVWSGGAWQANLLVRYVYDGMVVVQERQYAPQVSTTSPQLVVNYTRGLDLSGNVQGAGGIGGLLARTAQTPATSQHTFYHSDGNGNVTCLINNNQRVVARYHYDPFGNIMAASGTLADGNLYRFSSKEWQEHSGLVYYGYRYYSPSLQRWINRDPIEEEGGANLYGFVANQPVNGIDLIGLLLSAGGGTPHVSGREHDNYLVFTITCPRCYRFVFDHVDYSAVVPGLLAAGFTTSQIQDAEPLGGAVGGDPQNVNCWGNPTTMRVHMRTRFSYWLICAILEGPFTSPSPGVPSGPDYGWVCGTHRLESPHTPPGRSFTMIEGVAGLRMWR